ncbi:MAG: glycosyltransferase family 4 protein [bacterium]|nr:glycosyltransferase family 4 protein [bacterium]
MAASDRHLSVLHGKFHAYLLLGQPFLHDLVSGLERHCVSSVLCSQVENRQRFPVKNLYRINTRHLIDEPYVLLAAAEIRRLIAPHLLHAHFGWSGLRMLPVAQFLRLPLITTFGGKDLGQEARDPNLATPYKRLFESCSALVCVSKDLGDRLSNLGADTDRIRVIRRGVNLERLAFNDRSQRSAEDSLRLLVVGRLIEKKGHVDAIAAVAAIRREGINAELSILGEGTLRDGLERCVRELGIGSHVTFHGAKSQDEVFTAMREADLLIHSARISGEGDVEGIPNAVIEAAATGLPVVATRHGGIAEAVSHEETGLLVDEESPQALAGALIQLATEKARRLAMGRCARSLMVERFDIARQIDEYLALYTEVVERHGTKEKTDLQVAVSSDDFGSLRATFALGSGDGVISPIEVSRWAFPGKSGEAILRAVGQASETSGSRSARLPRILKRPSRWILAAVAKCLLGPSIKGQRESGPNSALNALRLRVLQFVCQGGAIDSINPGWSLPQLRSFLAQVATTRHNVDPGVEDVTR